MTADSDFSRIFDHADVLLVVDEWKGHDFTNEPELLLARSFDKSTLPLYRTLCAHRADSWHASGKRGEFSSLFADGAYRQVMADIEQTNTRQYHHLFKDLGQYKDGSPAGDNWRRIMLANPSLAKIWKKKAPRHARVLFWFLEGLLRCLQLHVLENARVLVILDRQDWNSGRRRRPVVPPASFAYVGGRDDSLRAQVVTIVDKESSDVLPYLPFLGLVDSEAWALGRWLSLKLPDGTRVHDRCMVWLSQGRPTSDPLPQELEGLVERFAAENTELMAYLQAQLDWRTEKAIDVDEGFKDTDADTP